MVNIVERFEGDNIKTRHGGSGKEYYSPAGWRYGMEKAYPNELEKAGKARYVEGVSNAKISDNVKKINKSAESAQTNNHAGYAR